MPEYVENDWIHRNLNYEDLTLDESPVKGEEGRLLEPVSAKLYSTFYCQCPDDLSNHVCDLVLAGDAKKKMILELTRALHGYRIVALEFFPDGTRVGPEWKELAPSKKIVCKMDNGRVIILEHYAEPDAWCVVGEVGLSLGLRNGGTTRLIDADAWVPLWPTVAD
jgi:hypothetical protein